MTLEERAMEEAIKSIDKQRLIYDLFMNGFCITRTDETGVHYVDSNSIEAQEILDKTK